jgi:hypothetical protein
MSTLASESSDTAAAGARLGAGRPVPPDAIPDTVRTSLHELTTADGAKTNGVLHRVPASPTVVTLMHPRQDVTHHPLVPILLGRGFSVWTQGSRSVNNDLTLVHEQTLLDVAAGLTFLRERGFDSLVTLGHSGGGALYAYYIEQSALPPGERIATTPAGRPTRLAETTMPAPDAALFLAPHPGQGALLLGCIDPSVADEADPLSITPELDPFNPANGFAEPPHSACYTAEFLDRYRAAQRARVARIDAVARERVAQAGEARARYKRTGLAQDRRVALAPRLITVYRSDADPRTVDLSIDPNDRPYGSVFGSRPDLINYGLVGFGRLTTPDAWLSTWSGLSSKAGFIRCAPGVTVPSLLIELTGDQAAFPGDSARMFAALGATDKTHERVRGTHFGGPITPGEPPGTATGGSLIADWLADRFTARPL